MNDPRETHDREATASVETAEARFSGTVERITYRHPETRYTVLKLRPEAGRGHAGTLFSSGKELVTGVGSAPELVEGQRVKLRGTWTRHPRHGRQFQFESLEVLPPLDRDGLIRYLSSSSFKGVGPTLAARIVDELGTGALRMIREDPGVLRPIRGLGRGVRKELASKLREKLAAQEQLAALYGLNLFPWQAELVVEKFGAQAEERLREDPYVLAREIRGIGFQTADKIAREMGIAADAPARRRAALGFTLERAAGEGHTLLTRERLCRRAGELAGLSPVEDEWAGEIETLARQGEVTVDLETRPGEPLVYLPALHTAERALAENLGALLRVGTARPLADRTKLEAAERRAGIELHSEQQAAILGLLSSPLALLTGGPGVGKTTIVKLVVALAQDASARVVLASPTGRAAKRLSEATGHEAKTVHRLLGWEPRTGAFQHDARRPIEADLVVVDEISMLDVILAHHLVKAIQPPTRLVLVGDPDQLPSVTAGSVLADLLASGRIPVWRLSHIFRQKQESQIVVNAHRILAGENPSFPARGDARSDFYFFRAEGEQQASDLLIDVVTRRVPERFGLDWMRDVQILSPMYRGACGVDALNERLRSALGAGGREMQWRGRTWREGDRVIHTKNDYEKQVFNGDMGRVAHIAPDGDELVVLFPEREVVYRRNELVDLRPAFAITVHRSQGGEFPCVVMPIVSQHFAMLERHLLYTAVTRAKRLVVLVGSERALARCIANAEVKARESALAERLEESRGLFGDSPEGAPS